MEQKCPQCGWAYDTRSDLNKHIKSKHSQIENISDRNMLHINNHQNLEENISHGSQRAPNNEELKCSHCGKVFRSKKIAKRHDCKNNKQRPSDKKYNCHLCRRTFKNSLNLDVHLGEHWGTGEHFVYKCSYRTCNWLFNEYDSL